jgi:hypothetical protein
LNSLCVPSLSLHFIEFIVYTKPFSLFHWIHCVYQAFVSISLNSLCIPNLFLYFIELLGTHNEFNEIERKAWYTQSIQWNRGKGLVIHNQFNEIEGKAWLYTVYQAFVSISLNSLCIPNLFLYFIEFIVYTKPFSLFHWIHCVYQAFLSISLNSLCIPGLFLYFIHEIERKAWHTQWIECNREKVLVYTMNSMK